MLHSVPSRAPVVCNHPLCERGNQLLNAGAVPLVRFHMVQEGCDKMRGVGLERPQIPTACSLEVHRRSPAPSILAAVLAAIFPRFPRIAALLSGRCD